MEKVNSEKEAAIASLNEWMKKFKITRSPNYTEKDIPLPGSEESFQRAVDFFKKHGLPKGWGTL